MVDVDEMEILDSVEKERKKVLIYESNKMQCEGLRILGLEKIYNFLPFGLKSKKDLHAVKQIYLEVPDKELLCILGHNGAGKSTLFNMLTGILNPSGGDAFIFGYDIATQQDEIRMLMGVVPQFDILWQELTALEHMKMFSIIKGVPQQQILDKSINLLSRVGLKDVMNARVSQFSGGMKRRLTVAMSVIGDPKIVFMDEPTTGMDPVSRKDVWKLIQEMKQNRVMILTTHAMEEADILSDRIAVVVDGQFKCVGTSLFLKNNFGEGYRINIVAIPGQEERIIQIIDMISPSNNLIDQSGQSLIFTIPFEKIHEITPFFQLIQVDEDSKDMSPYLLELKSLIHDFGISHTTLEGVFMKVTGKKQKIGNQEN